jgi:hypothetical protein
MISDSFNRGMLYQEFVSRVLQAAAPKIIKEQHARVYTYYNKRTGHIGEALSTQAFKISGSPGSAILEISYLIDLRFLDMKTTRYGKKKLYGPVYNKPLWGYVYGYVFGTVRYGLTVAVQKDIFNAIRESYKNPLQQ